MKILVTGGAGFVGVNLIKKLLKDQHNVVSVDNYSIGTETNHIEGALYHDLDVNSIAKLTNDFDLIFHLAGLSRIQPSFLQPTQTFQANACGGRSSIGMG
jgi:UDP-glucose 4-epimerase